MRSTLVKVALAACLLIALVLLYALVPLNPPVSPSTERRYPAGPSVQASTFRLGSWAGWDLVGYLCDQVGVSRDYDGYRFVVENHLLPMAIGGKGLGGFGSGKMPDRYSQEIDSWLAVCDEYGMSNWLEYVGWGYPWAGWEGITGGEHPEAMSYNSLGEEQPTYLCPIDHFDVVFPWHREKLKEAVDLYADHSSITGFGDNPFTDGPIYMALGGTPRPPGDKLDYGFNPASFKNFTETPYFLRDVDESGHHLDGTPCRLWEQYVAESANYSLAELIDDVRGYHYANVREYPLHGYVAYMNVENAKLVRALYDWLVSYRPDRTWTVKHPFTMWVAIEAGLWDSPAQALVGIYDYEEVTFQKYSYRMMSRGQSYDPSARYVLGWSNLCNPGDNPFYIPGDEERYNLYLIGIPTLPMTNPIMEVDWGDDYIVDPSVTAIYRSFGSKMNLMRDYGGWFGMEASYVKALAIGETEVGWAPQMLTSTIDLAMAAGEWEDANITRFGDFTQFDLLIIWGGGRPGRESLSTDCRARVLSFVSNGGGLVVFGDVPSWLPLGPGTLIGVGHPVTRPLTDLTGGPTLYEWTYGAGKVTQVLNPPGITRLEYISRSSDFWVLATNAVLYSAGREDLLPAWFYEAGPYTATRWSNIYHSVCGVPGEALIWLSNRGTETESVEIHLNPLFYGIDPDGWLLIDPTDLTVNAGSGEITLRADVPGLSWSPIYVVSKPVDYDQAYCNLAVLSRSVSESEVRFTVEGFPSQSVRLIVYAPSEPKFVNTAGLGELAGRESREDLVASGNGWFYDAKSQLLFVAYANPSGSGEVRIVIP